MKTQAQLEIENAELRGQVKALREMLETLLTRPSVPQFVPLPCPLPHHPPPQVQPAPWLPIYPDITYRDPNILGTLGPKTSCATPPQYHGLVVHTVPGCAS